jgi:hypothetical protein
MSWTKANELVIANDGQAFFAPVGTPLPVPGDDPTAALDKAFVGAGWITDNGAALNVGSTVVDINAWQTRNAIRREKTAQEITCIWAMQQWNESNIVLAFGGGEVVDEGEGLFSYKFPKSSDPLDERSLVMDAIDGENHLRFVFPRGNVTDAVEAKFARGAASELPITFKVLEPAEGGDIAYFLTDAAGFAVGS